MITSFYLLLDLARLYISHRLFVYQKVIQPFSDARLSSSLSTTPPHIPPSIFSGVRIKMSKCINKLGLFQKFSETVSLLQSKSWLFSLFHSFSYMTIKVFMSYIQISANYKSFTLIFKFKLNYVLFESCVVLLNPIFKSL